MTQHTHDRLLIIDFGSQVTQLDCAPPARTERLLRNPPLQTVDDAFLAQFAPKAVILSGGPASSSTRIRRARQHVFEMDVPVLGICYGQQVMMQMLGGKVENRRMALPNLAAPTSRPTMQD